MDISAKSRETAMATFWDEGFKELPTSRKGMSFFFFSFFFFMITGCYEDIEYSATVPGRKDATTHCC